MNLYERCLGNSCSILLTWQRGSIANGIGIQNSFPKQLTGANICIVKFLLQSVPSFTNRSSTCFFSTRIMLSQNMTSRSGNPAKLSEIYLSWGGNCDCVFFLEFLLILLGNNFPDWIYTHILHCLNIFYLSKRENHTQAHRCLHEVKDLMKSIGFGYPGGPDRAANLELPVTSYSGGWKMKMQLCSMAALERKTAKQSQLSSNERCHGRLQVT